MSKEYVTTTFGELKEGDLFCLPEESEDGFSDTYKKIAVGDVTIHGDTNNGSIDITTKSNAVMTATGLGDWFDDNEHVAITVEPEQKTDEEEEEYVSPYEKKVKCTLCGSEYYDFEGPVYIKDLDKSDNFDLKGLPIVCWDCVKKTEKDCKYWFVNYYPTFCEGFPYYVAVSNDLDKMCKYIESYCIDENEKDYVMAMSDRDNNCNIMIVSKDGNHWWVRGSSNIPKETWPNWETLANIKRN